MKRGTLVAVAILVVLLGVFFVTREEPPQYERSPMTIQQVEGLSRIEIERPAGTDSTSSGDAGETADDSQAEKIATKVVLEKRDGRWWLVQPVEAPASEETSEDIEEAFGSSVGTADLPIEGSSDNQKKYKLLPHMRATVRLFGGGGEKPAVELHVGEQITVQQTDAERTFVQKPGGDRIYRATMAIGEWIRQPVSDFRSDEIVDLSKENLTRIEWRYEDGFEMVLEKREGSWSLVRPQVEWELDQNAVKGAVGAIATMSADGFADDRDAAAIGLNPPTARVVATTETGTDSADEGSSPDASSGEGAGSGGTRKVELLVGRVETNGEPEYYTKVKGERYHYKLASYDGEKLLSRLGDIRSKTPREFDKKSITEVEFPGEAGVVVRKEEGSWSLVRPEMEKSLNEKKLDSKLSAVASLPVVKFPEISAAKAGLGGGADRLRFRTEEGEYSILFGDEIDGKSGARYVKFGDGDEVFVVSRITADKLHPSGDDLVGEMKRPARGAHKGLPKGMGGMRKKQILRKLKQKMGR